jgi:sec-independent protein translocase protein TatA
MRLGWPEMILILVIVLIVFGVGKLPQVGGAIGKGIREFRKGASGYFDQEEKEAGNAGVEDLTRKGARQNKV